MKKKRWDGLLFQWKRSLRDEVVNTEGGSGGGGAGEGAAGGGEPKGGEGAGGGEAEGGEIDFKSEFEKLKGEHETFKAESGKVKEELGKFQNFHAAAMAHLETDEQGNLRPKKTIEAHAPSAAEIAARAQADEITSTVIKVQEQTRAAEEKIINEFKATDVLFSKNLLAMREKLAAVPAQQRTEAVMRRAYAMAQGEAHTEYQKYYREQGRKEALDEFSRQSGGSLPSSKGGAGGNAPDGKMDLSRVKLSRAEVVEANKMLNAGLIKSIDEYKENLVYLNGVEETMED